MKIQAVNCFKINFPTKKSHPVSFKGELDSDIFEKSADFYKKTKVKNLKDEELDAYITRKTRFDCLSEVDPVDFSIYVDGEKKGSASVEETVFGNVYLSNVETEENSKRNYKGLGTELIKCAVEESRAMGKKGELEGCAFYNPEAPFLFYFKNNFKISQNSEISAKYPKLYNAPLQYLAKHHGNINDLIPQDRNIFYMELDEKGANALMEGKRLYEQRICDDIERFSIDGRTYSTQFIESPNKNEYFLQILDEDRPDAKLALIYSLKAITNKDGQKCFEITNTLDDFPASRIQVNRHAFGLLDKLAKKYL